MKQLLLVAILLTAVALGWSVIHTRLEGELHAVLEAMLLAALSVLIVVYVAHELLRGEAGIGPRLAAAHGHGHHGHGRIPSHGHHGGLAGRTPTWMDPDRDERTPRNFLRGAS